MKKFITLALVLLCGLGASAQKSEKFPIWEDFNNNLYIDAGIGIQTMFASDWKDIAFGKQITPSFSLGVGKWFNPFWGVHIDAYGYSTNGFRAGEIGDAEPFDPLNNVDLGYDGSFRYHLRHFGIRGDFRINLLNMINGRIQKNRIYDLDLFLGLGYKRAFAYRGTINKNLITTHLGARNSFRVHKNVDINLDIIAQCHHNYVDPNGKAYAHELAINAGVSYIFGERNYRKDVMAVPVETVRFMTDTVLVREIPVEGKERIIEINRPELDINVVLGAIRFKLNHSKPNAHQEIQLVEVARFLERYPDSQVKIEGYADATTGTKEYNEKLSKERTDAVYDLLVNTYHVNKDQLIAAPMGTDAQPYPDEPIWNCVTLIRLVK